MMGLKLSKTAVYAIFAALHIRMHHGNGLVPGHSIAESCGIPHESLLKILQGLVRAEIVESERGPRGGYRLSRPPVETTLLDIVEAVEGTIGGSVVIRNSMPVPRRAKAIVEDLCNKSAASTRAILRDTTIEHLFEAEVQPAPSTEHAAAPNVSDVEEKVPVLRVGHSHPI